MNKYINTAEFIILCMFKQYDRVCILYKLCEKEK